VFCHVPSPGCLVLPLFFSHPAFCASNSLSVVTGDLRFSLPFLLSNWINVFPRKENPSLWAGLFCFFVLCSSMEAFSDYGRAVSITSRRTKFSNYLSSFLPLLLFSNWVFASGSPFLFPTAFIALFPVAWRRWIFLSLCQAPSPEMVPVPTNQVFINSHLAIFT